VVRDHPQTYAGCSGARAGDECQAWVEADSRSWTGICEVDRVAHGALACVPRREDTAIDECDERARRAGSPRGYVMIEVHLFADGRRDYSAAFVHHLSDEHVQCLVDAYRFAGRHHALPAKGMTDFGLRHLFRPQ
jgi:hypothetical protein